MRGDSLGAGAADEQSLDAIQVSSTSTDTGLALLALGAVALGLALNGQSSSPGLPTTSAPTILEAAVPVPPPVEGEKPADVLKPRGQNVGEPVEIPWGERLMRTLTDRERRSLVEEFHAESEGDLVGLWEIAKEVEELVGTGETAREQSLMIVRDLLAKGLIAGDPPYRPGGYKA